MNLPIGNGPNVRNEKMGEIAGDSLPNVILI